jgi:hypothetical protein
MFQSVQSEKFCKSLTIATKQKSLELNTKFKIIYLYEIGSMSYSKIGRQYRLSYILESNPHPFYSFRGLKMQMWIRI